jgi:hypothetical protein
LNAGKGVAMFLLCRTILPETQSRARDKKRNDRKIEDRKMKNRQICVPWQTAFFFVSFVLFVADFLPQRARRAQRRIWKS